MTSKPCMAAAGGEGLFGNNFRPKKGPKLVPETISTYNSIIKFQPHFESKQTKMELKTGTKRKTKEIRKVWLKPARLPTGFVHETLSLSGEGNPKVGSQT